MFAEWKKKRGDSGVVERMQTHWVVGKEVEDCARESAEPEGLFVFAAQDGQSEKRGERQNGGARHDEPLQENRESG